MSKQFKVGIGAHSCNRVYLKFGKTKPSDIVGLSSLEWEALDSLSRVINPWPLLVVSKHKSESKRRKGPFDEINRRRNHVLYRHLRIYRSLQLTFSLSPPPPPPQITQSRNWDRPDRPDSAPREQQWNRGKRRATTSRITVLAMTALESRRGGESAQ
jgi:hypothetical protein